MKSNECMYCKTVKSTKKQRYDYQNSPAGIMCDECWSTSGLNPEKLNHIQRYIVKIILADGTAMHLNKIVYMPEIVKDTQIINLLTGFGLIPPDLPEKSANHVVIEKIGTDQIIVHWNDGSATVLEGCNDEFDNNNF